MSAKANELLLDRTVNIILIAKRFGNADDRRRAIAQYMSEECCCPIETYTEELLLKIVREASFDFLHHASRTEDIICFFRILTAGHYNEMVDNIIIALGGIQINVKSGWEYKPINGWHETEFTKKLDADEWHLEKQPTKRAIMENITEQIRDCERGYDDDGDEVFDKDSVFLDLAEAKRVLAFLKTSE